MATPRRFGPPSLDSQLAANRITSVPALLGGVTCAHVELVVFPVSRPALLNISCRYSDRTS